MKEIFRIPPNVNGDGVLFFEWDPSCKYLALCGEHRRVSILSRTGETIDDFPLQGNGPCLALSWDAEGEFLAVLQQGNEVISLWNSHARELTSLKTNLNKPNFLVWARAGPYLAVTTERGNLLIYNKLTLKKVIVQGKHSKSVTCGMWNLDNKLALASKDKTLTISDEKGTTLYQETLKNEPVSLRFAVQKQDEKTSGAENTLSVNLANKSILLYNIQGDESPMVVAFQAKYGEIVCYEWFGDGYIIIGFSKGHVVSISTHKKEIGEELNTIRNHDTSLSHVVYSDRLKQFASCGNDGVRIIDAGDWKEITNSFIPLLNTHRLAWSTDGQLLTVGTNNGELVTFLTSIPRLATHCNSKLAYLSSLRTVTISDRLSKMSDEVRVPLSIEPRFIALGPLNRSTNCTYLAVGMNNHAWFYAVQKSASVLLCEKEYVSTVQRIVINEMYCAVLCDGKLYVHAVDPRMKLNDKDLTLQKSGETITAVDITKDFLIYGTSGGSIHYFYFEDWKPIEDYRHDAPIIYLSSNVLGTELLFIDENHQAFLFNPVDSTRLLLERFPTAVSNVLWDPIEQSTFVVIDTLQKNAFTYAIRPQTLSGYSVKQVAKTQLSYHSEDFAPVLLCEGSLHGQKASGAPHSIVLSSHSAINNLVESSTEKMRQAMQQYIGLGRLQEAWNIAARLGRDDVFRMFAKTALEMLEIELAVLAYRRLGDAATVLELQRLLFIEDKNLLVGHINVLSERYDEAQNLFLHSSRPIAALEMRKDLLQWGEALRLAEKLDPEQAPFICSEYAQQLEFEGNFQLALTMYERGELQEVTSDTDAEHNRVAMAGRTRMTIRLGDIRRGRDMALRSADKRLLKDCAAILESMKQYSEAAELYVKAESYERAASIYIQSKDFTHATPLMQHITTPKLHTLYAQAKEAEGRYEQAAEAYERAHDYDSVVRLNLKQLNNPEKAFAIVRKNRSSHGAAMVAAFCQQSGNWQGAIEFMLLAERAEEAYQLAQARGEMETYAKALGDSGTMEQYIQVAVYYESVQDYGKAGEFYAFCGKYLQAVKLFLMCGDERIEDAINVVRKCRGKAETKVLVPLIHDFLIGERDNNPRDTKYIYKLYVAIGDWEKAADIALLIARQNQQLGSYQAGHDILFEAYQDLVAQDITPSEELKHDLMLLHSYVIVKVLVKDKNDEGAARMLMRIAHHISKFPTHVVQLLTSTVMECSRAKLRRSAFEYASMLMRPEYRKQIAERHRKKIEAIVRRPPTDQEPEERFSPCPFCNFDLPESLLSCPSCKNTVPYCATTGNHMTLSDWTVCPSCRFPSRFSAFKVRILSDKTCLMCREPVAMVNVRQFDASAAKDSLMQLCRSTSEGDGPGKQ